MNKRVSTRVLVLLLVAVLLIGCSIGGTLAWLMVKTDPVTNTFTVGDIKITLTEHELDKNGKATATTTTKGNDDIQAVPGRTIDKDPTVTVLAGSEPCYVRVLMRVHWTGDADNLFEAFAYNQWIDFADGWTMKSVFDGATKHNNGTYYGYDIYELRFTGTIAAVNGGGYVTDGVVYAENGNVVLPVFNGMTIPANLTNEQIAALQDCGIDFVAQAVQVESFADADAAWKDMPVPVEFQKPNTDPDQGDGE